jgi:hypothetical protein
MIISATVIILKKRSHAFKLMKAAGPAMKQAKNADGVRYVRAYSLDFKNWYTLTAWDTETQLLGFVRSGAHIEAMKLTAQIADRVKSLRWESDAIPTKKEERRKLADV